MIGRLGRLSFPTLLFFFERRSRPPAWSHPVDFEGMPRLPFPPGTCRGLSLRFGRLFSNLGLPGIFPKAGFPWESVPPPLRFIVSPLSSLFFLGNLPLGEIPPTVAPLTPSVDYAVPFFFPYLGPFLQILLPFLPPLPLIRQPLLFVSIPRPPSPKAGRFPPPLPKCFGSPYVFLKKGDTLRATLTPPSRVKCPPQLLRIPCPHHLDRALRKGEHPSPYTLFCFVSTKKKLFAPFCFFFRA